MEEDQDEEVNNKVKYLKNRFIKVYKSSATIRKKICCCGYSLEAGSYFIGFVLLAVCAVAFAALCDIPLEDKNISVAADIGLYILVIIIAVINVLLIAGTIRKNMYLLIPWLIMVMLGLLLNLSFYLYKLSTRINDKDDPDYWETIGINLKIQLFLFFFWISVLFLFFKFKKLKNEVRYNNLDILTDNIDESV